MQRPMLNEAEIFNAARIITDAAERERFLQQACGADEPLRQRVQNLIEAYDRNPEFLSHTTFLNPEDPRHGLVESLGAQIGPYRPIQFLGEGGMGAVFLAEQEHPIRRRVALKIIKPGMDSREVVARFNAERQALALMDHPGIARVFDAGTTEAGRPYFVMELIDGLPITTYCEQNRLSPRERLRLFAAVCDAIQHAHQKGIIHRDIKPRNILVIQVDGAAIPKVIDFGVAKAIHAPLPQHTLVTSFDQVLGTIDYMSPEQIRRTPADVDTRADIYALGVLLYEMLTGALPFDRARLRSAAIHEVQRIICEEEPPRPSRRLLPASGFGTTPATDPGEASQLRRELERDLDWVVMKAMEKDRERRYDSVSGLASEVRRFLNHEPVLATPPSVKYRLVKLYRRKRGVIVAAGLVIAALVGGTAVATQQTILARNSAREAEKAAGETTIALDKEQAARQEVDRIAAGQRDNLRQLLTVSGYNDYEKQDYFRALAWYRAAAAVDPEGVSPPSSLQQRISACLEKCPRLIGVATSAHDARLSPDGQRMVAAHSGARHVRSGRSILPSVEGLIPLGGEFRKDGSLILVTWKEADRTLQSWEEIDGVLKPLAEPIVFNADIHDIMLSPDGEFMIVKSNDIRVIATATAKDVISPFPDHTNGNLLRWLARFSPQSRFLTFPKCDVFTLDSKMQISHGITEGSFPGLEFSPDESLVAIRSFTVPCELRSRETGEVISQAAANDSHGNQFNPFRFSPDGKLLAGIGRNEIVLWKVPTLELQKIIAIPGVQGAKFSPDSRRLAIINIDGTCTLRDVASGEPVEALLRFESLSDVEFSADGRYLLTFGSNAHVWDLQRESETTSEITRESILDWPTLSNNERYLIANRSEPVVMDLRTGATKALEGAEPVNHEALQAPDFPTILHHGTAKTAVLPDGILLHSMTSANGQFAVGFRSARTLHVWELSSGKKISSLQHDANLLSAAINNSGQQVLIAAENGVRLYETRTGKPSSPLLNLPEEMQAPDPQFAARTFLLYEAAFAEKQGLLIATGSFGMCAWKLSDFTLAWARRFMPTALIPKAMVRPVLPQPGLVLSNDESFVIPTHTSIPVLLETRTGVEKFPQELLDALQTQGPFTISFSDDTSLMLWARFPGGLYLKAMNDGRILSSSRMLDARSRDADLSPDGTLVVSLPFHGGVMVWDVSTGLPLWEATEGSDGKRLRFDRCFFENNETVVAVGRHGDIYRKTLRRFTNFAQLDALTELAAEGHIDTSGRFHAKAIDIRSADHIQKLVDGGLP